MEAPVILCCMLKNDTHNRTVAQSSEGCGVHTIPQLSKLAAKTDINFPSN